VARANLNLVIAVVICLSVPLAAYPAPPADKTGCATCHQEEARLQPKTAMGIGIELADDQAVLKAHPRLSCESNGYKYLIERKDGVSIYTVSDGAGSLALPIRYVFGTSSQTFVFEYSGQFYESMVSYYPNAGGLAVTMGSERLRPRNLVEAMGRETSMQEIVSCFGCHSSDGVSQGRLTLDSMRPGLDCEHCQRAPGGSRAGQAGGHSPKAGRDAGGGHVELLWHLPSYLGCGGADEDLGPAECPISALPAGQ
jgi:hypothetical protein